MGSVKRKITGIAARAALICLMALAAACPPARASSPPIGTLIVNRALVSYRDAGGNPMPGVEAQAEVTVSGAPVLFLRVTESSDPTAMGSLLVYTIYYENSGNSDASNVVLTNSISDYVIFSSATGGGVYAAGPAGGTVSWNLGSLAVGQSGTLTLTGVVKTAADYPPADPSAISVGDVIENSITMVSDETQTNYTNSIMVGAGPNLKLSLSASSAVVGPGGTITYALHYKNIGNADASLARVINELPSETSLVENSITGGGVLSGRIVSWDLGAIVPGAEGDLEFSVSVSSISALETTITNIASITCAELAPAVSNSVETYIRKASLSVTKTGLPAFAGNDIYYTILISNDGYIQLSNVFATDPIPEKTSFVSADNGGTFSNGSVSWNIGDLSAGESKTLKLLLNVPDSELDGDTIKNVATVTADDSDPVSATATTVVSARDVDNYLEIYNKTYTTIKRTLMTYEDIYLQVNDADRNINPNTKDTLEVTIVDKLSGDTETVVLTEVGTNSEMFRGCVPNILNSGQCEMAATRAARSSATAATSGNGHITLTAGGELEGIYIDPFDPNGTPLSRQFALVEPQRRVFNSMTGEPVAGAVVTLTQIDQSVETSVALPYNQPNPSPSVAGTSADGVFTFYYVPKTPDGAHYRVSVAVGGNFTFPSLIPNSEMPKQYRVDERSKGNPFVTPLPGEFEDAGVVESGDLVYYPLNFDIPVDPPVIELLAVTKTADKKNATIGDIVRYTVRVSNSGSWPVNDITVTDILPHGMQYIDGSTTLSGAAADPARPASMTLAWSVTSLAAGGYFEISYSTVVGVDSKRGDGKNTAYAQGTLGAKTVSSNTAYYTVTIKEGVFTSNGTIVGKVFVDSDGDGMQSRGEPGVSGVAIYMEDGARIVTGTDGKYSVIGVTPGLHVLKIEAKTLPAGISISSLSTNRFAGDPDSQFIDMVSGGIMNADFTVSGDKESADRRNMETREKAATSGQAAAAGRTEFVYVPLEEEISSMTPDLDILYPEDGSVSSAANTNITVKAPLAAKVYLFLNDEPVSSKRVGKKITESELEIAIYQYIGIQLAPGAENAIRAETRDEDGNITSEKEIRITAAGLPAKIEVKPEKTEIIADGASKARVSASVYDDKGLPVAYEGIATVETTSGEIDTKDADASMDGVQVLYSGGAARFDVKAPRQAGEAVITVAFGELQGSAKVHFTPDLGDNLSVGLVEFRFGSGKAGGDTELIRSSDGWFDRGGYAGARGALFTKRKIGDDSLLTLSYDSHKSKRPDLFFNSLRNPDAEDQYPIYGDDSVTSFEAQSREKLYLRLDRRKSHLLFGDFETGFNETKLSAYSRSFNGLKIGMNTDKYRLSAFETHTDQSQVVDAIPGRGVSGYYYLSAAPIMDGSETVAVEIRDRLRPEAALNRDTLSRWSEYSIDYETGAILLKDPLPSYDEDLNPVYLIVSYETEGGGNTYYIYGARLRFKLNDRLGVGFTGVTQEAETSDYHLWGMDFDYKLHKLTTLKYEFAETKSLFNIDNILALKNGGGWSFELKSDALERTKITAYWRNTRSYFGNMSAVDAQRGMEKKGLEFSFLKNRNTTLAGKFFTERDSVNYMDHRLSSILLKRTIRNMKFESELLRESSNDNFIITNTDRTRYPFDISERTPSKTTAARFSLTGNIRPRLALTLEHQQDIQDNNFNVSSAKLDYKLKGAGHLYARREFWRLDGSRSWRNVLGVETPIARDTSAFNEYRLEGGADGRRVQRAIGVRNKFALNDRVSGSVSLEKLNTVKGAEMQRDPDAFAVTAGTEFVFMRDVKMTARAEYRDSTLDTSRLAELGLAAKMGTDYSLLLRQRWSNTGYSTGAQRTTTGSMVGVAYRPAHNNRFNAFARIEFKRDRSSPVVSDSTPSARIYSIEGVYHPSKSFSLTGKYAAKISKTDLFRSYTDMVAGRFTYDLTSRFDIGLEARTLRSRSINSQSIGGSAELGYKCLKNIWLTTGYSFDDFDSDLAGDSYWGKGPYISIKFKFD